MSKNCESIKKLSSFYGSFDLLDNLAWVAARAARSLRSATEEVWVADMVMKERRKTGEGHDHTDRASWEKLLELIDKL